MSKKRMLVICPHLSTGGSPECSAKKIELLKNDFEIKVVEHSFLAAQFVVQRNKIINLVTNDNFYSLHGDKLGMLKLIVDDFQPDIVSMEEFPEMFMENEITNWLYRKDRPYTIYESTHDSSFNTAHKRYMPDRFIFVSPYTALKYAHLDVPNDIIQYPVDNKEQQKEALRKKLGLEDGYKHVVIVGLFTPRKNQKYAMQLCEATSSYNIKYHFLGNQAGNFSFYWKPLMEWKEKNPNLNNCVIWGERADIDDFLNAADLFLFPSRGDRGNKELNPIVILEAMRYNKLPKLLFNLDVYLNKYNNKDGVHYLSGNTGEDARKVIELTNATSELVIIGTYPNLKSRVELTKETIQSLKCLGKKIMLVSHYPVDQEIQKMVDFYVYDAHNPLSHHSYYTLFFRNTEEFRAEININGLKNSNQSLAVLTNLFNAAKLARSLGYTSFFYTTYDVVLNELDVPVVEKGFLKLNMLDAYLGTLKTPFGRGIQTNGMFFNTDKFLDLFEDVRFAEDYNRACEKAGSHNFLEDFMMKKIASSGLKYELEQENETLLINSGLGVASNSEYYSILPVAKKDSTYMFYFYTYNIDDRKVNVRMMENGIEFFNASFTISKCREYKKEFVYSGKQITVVMDFYDGDTIYKSENFVMNNENINIYKQTGFFKWFTKPKVKLVHLQTTLNDEREQKSRASLQEVQKYGIEYVLHTNVPYADLPPKFNCLRPQCVSLELFDEEMTKRYGSALTPAHYGCFESFKNGILSEFDDCDFLIVCEGDCLLQVPAEEFCNKVFEAARLCDDNNIGYFSFGDKATLEHGWLQSKEVEKIPNQNLIFITNHIIGIQCIMFPKFAKKWLKERFLVDKWDAADVFLNYVFRNSPYKMGIVHKRLTTQADGFSLIDKQEKKFQ